MHRRTCQGLFDERCIGPGRRVRICRVRIYPARHVTCPTSRVKRKPFIIARRGPIMNFHDQDRQAVVTLSAAKGLSLWAQRCFAALSMTGPVLLVKIHYLRWAR